MARTVMTDLPVDETLDGAALGRVRGGAIYMNANPLGKLQNGGEPIFMNVSPLSKQQNGGVPIFMNVNPTS